MRISINELSILVADDDPAILLLLRRSFVGLGSSVQEAQSVNRALDLIRGGAIDLVVLDLDLPEIGGLELIRQIREEDLWLPIIALTVRPGETIKVAALDLGADDIISKPFGVDELLARVRTVVRHRIQRQGEPPIFRSGDLVVDLVRRIVTVRGAHVKFSRREYDLLRLLVANAGKVMTHEDLLHDVWGGDTNVQYLRFYIRSLRQKIEVVPKRPAHILTEAGVGYRLQAGKWSPPNASSPPRRNE
jgi:two-component system, OmpR family, KDP operon response regulator KdpE